MKSLAILVLAAQAGTSAVAFAPSAPLRLVSTTIRASSTLNMAYIPDGLSPAEWKKIQAEEKKKRENLGKVGPQRFKSRSFQAWQESGAGHLFPVDPQKVNFPRVHYDLILGDVALRPCLITRTFSSRGERSICVHVSSTLAPPEILSTKYKVL